MRRGVDALNERIKRMKEAAGGRWDGYQESLLTNLRWAGGMNPWPRGLYLFSSGWVYGTDKAESRAEQGVCNLRGAKL